MKKIVLCIFIFGVMIMPSEVRASEMESEVGIEFSQTIKDPPRKNLPDTNSPKRFLPQTGDSREEAIKYSIAGMVILTSGVLFLKGNRRRKRGEI